MPRACVVCIDLPQGTLTDRSIGGEAIVSGAPVPDRPFQCRTQETIAGAPTAPIPFWVDSTRRRSVTADPSEALLALLALQHRAAQEQPSVAAEAAQACAA